MRVDADFSFTWPTGQQIVDAGINGVRWYCGPARPTLDVVRDYDAHGLAQLSIFERTSDRAESSGYAGGVEDARYWLARTNEIRPGTPAAFVMSDGSSGDPSGDLVGTSNYARGVGDVLGFPFEAYGNEAAIAAAMRGSSLAVVDWIPETWTSRQGVGVRQLVGPVPIGGIDLNHVFTAATAPVPAPKPPPARRKGDTEMLLRAESDFFFGKAGHGFWLTVPGSWCELVGVNDDGTPQTLDQIVHNWGPLPVCPVPGPYIDKQILAVLHRFPVVTTG